MSAAARGLLGVLLVREDRGSFRSARIVEVEAYGGIDDRASHARHGRTARNASMFGAPGHAYVYGVYGMHTCLNVVCGPAGQASAVLIRAAEPLEGIATMRDARLARALAGRRADRDAPARAAARIADLRVDRLASGPGNVAAAFSVTRADDGHNLLDPASPLRLVPGRAGERRGEVKAGPRIGVAYAGRESASRAWRFRILGSPALSGRG